MEKIYLVPIGEVEHEILSVLQPPLEKRFGYPCQVGAKLGMPAEAYNARRRQHHSPTVLGRLRKRVPPDAKKVLGVAEADLYVPNLNFVFGQAELPGKMALISLCRLRQGFYGLKGDERLFQERAIKEAVHELGHTFGLVHCRRPDCVMCFSNSLLDTDRKGKDFCPGCRQKLKA